MKEKMVGNCEKMLLIPSSTTNKDKEQIDEKTLVMASNGGNHMEKPTQEQQQQPVLKCPRCDSSNTKFCYYNNYSLSQPRHFCKACKRYWTRGGTLRNVPVGGGCRKNKRIKKPSASSSSTTASVSLPNNTTTTNPSHNTHYINPPNPLLSGLGFSSSGNNHNIPFARLFSCRDEGQVFSGLGFPSSGGVMENYGHGFNSIKQIQDVMSCNNTTASTTTSLLSSYPMFGSLHTNNFHSLGPNNNYGHEELHMSGNNNGIMLKLEDKMEVGSDGHQIDQIISSDPSLSWNGAWLDPSNLGSSVPSLI